jgi:general secretion pathway protein A
VYTDFYNLKEKPFNLTPSPQFLYLGETHKEALSLLSYGVTESQGFVLLTGEVGTGKTTIVQTLLKNLDSAVHYVYLSNPPTLSVNDFLLYVSSGLGLQTKFKSKATFLIQFEGFLQRVQEQQKKVLLIVDEAQKLSFRILEELRLLSNMETADRKMIHIFLVGQPELNQKLRHAQCRPLLQRISIRYHIRPLNLAETEEYIKTRLQAAGARDSKLFPKNVIEAIHTYAMGYPRMINILCDNALLLGYAREKKRITVSMIQECYNDLELPESFLQSDTNPTIQEIPQKAEFMKDKSYRRPAALAFLLCLLLMLSSVTDIGKRYVHTAMLFYRSYSDPDVSPAEKDRSGGAKRGDLQSGKMVITIKPGDTLDKLSKEIYGSVNEKILASIQRENPEIKDINNLKVGQKIIFPRLKGIPWEK